jgi:hypothetical protein
VIVEYGLPIGDPIFPATGWPPPPRWRLAEWWNSRVEARRLRPSNRPFCFPGASRSSECCCVRSRYSRCIKTFGARDHLLLRLRVWLAGGRYSQAGRNYLRPASAQDTRPGGARFTLRHPQHGPFSSRPPPLAFGCCVPVKSAVSVAIRVALARSARSSHCTGSHTRRDATECLVRCSLKSASRAVSLVAKELFHDLSGTQTRVLRPCIPLLSFAYNSLAWGTVLRRHGPMDRSELLIRYVALMIEVQGDAHIDAVGPNLRLTEQEQAEMRKVEQQARVMLRR